MKIAVVDAFDLPEWLGIEPVVWHAVEGLDTGPLVVGTLRGDRSGTAREHVLDLLAVDAAYPRPVCPDEERHAVHQAWQFGEVALLDIDGRVAAGVPGTSFTADLACEALHRFARSVGASDGAYTVAITL
jgi:hypothetical protein